jgi:hypothetical protein
VPQQQACASAAKFVALKSRHFGTPRRTDESAEHRQLLAPVSVAVAVLPAAGSGLRLELKIRIDARARAGWKR